MNNLPLKSADVEDHVSDCVWNASGGMQSIGPPKQVWFIEKMWLQYGVEEGGGEVEGGEVSDGMPRNVVSILLHNLWSENAAVKELYRHLF